MHFVHRGFVVTDVVIDVLDALPPHVRSLCFFKGLTILPKYRFCVIIWPAVFLRIDIHGAQDVSDDG